MSLLSVERSSADDRSKAFLLGLYIGLSLLLFLSYLDPDHLSRFHKATNIYAIQALAGALLGFWRLRKSANNPKSLPALASVFISIGLAVWVIGQALWTWATFWYGEDKYPWFSDIFYMSSNVCWLSVLLMIFKSIERPILPAISSFAKVLLSIGVSLLLTGVPTWIASRLDPSSFTFGKIACDFLYILLTFSTALLAVGLWLGDNRPTPYPVNQCIRYLTLASAFDAFAILAFTIAVKLPPGYTLEYYNGNWVDWLFLTAMYFWGVSALKWPVREETLNYSFHTTRSKVVRVEDVYRAIDIANDYSQNAPLINSESVSWILDKIPGCWGVIKLGQQVVGSTFLLPVPRDLMARLYEAEPKKYKTDAQMYEEVQKREREIFEEAKKSSPTWDCLYLAHASVLTKHRRRGLAFKSFSAAIKNIKTEHDKPHIDVYYWSITTERTKLAEKLGTHFDENVITMKKLD